MFSQNASMIDPLRVYYTRVVELKQGGSTVAFKFNLRKDLLFLLICPTFLPSLQLSLLAVYAISNRLSKGLVKSFVAILLIFAEK